ncbi:MAG: hypothetical protein A2X46_02115 [Lentisphaerae bacterium GWF2_57_35]|nr:MAG: hypothetical protein A2X46_02115 [Lentisphaerae bacterium GWF2_57_35]
MEVAGPGGVKLDGSLLVGAKRMPNVIAGYFQGASRFQVGDFQTDFFSLANYDRRRKDSMVIQHDGDDPFSVPCQSCRLDGLRLASISSQRFPHG